MRQVTALGIGVLAAILLASCSGNVFSLKVGDCFNDPSDFQSDIANVDKVDCEESHDNEVFALFDIEEDSFPGLASLNRTAEDGCSVAFFPYVGRSHRTSALEIWWLTPSSQSWGSGDREVVCALYDATLAPLTGSMKDSGA